MPLDHFATTACGLVVHPDYAEMVLRSDDDYYGAGLVTATGGIGCVRSRALERDKPVVVNPLDYNAMVLGTAWDVALQAHAPKEAAKIRVTGIIEGMTVEGEIDRVRWVGPDLYIEDHKHSNNFRYKYIVEEGVQVEYVVQTSVYAELYAQTFGERPTRGIIWYSFSGGNTPNKPPLLPKAYSLMMLAECLDHCPYDGDYTVRELYQQAAAYCGGTVDAFDLPLVGETMRFGTKSYCDYCQVRETCFTQAKGAPF